MSFPTRRHLPIVISEWILERKFKSSKSHYRSVITGIHCRPRQTPSTSVNVRMWFLFNQFQCWMKKIYCYCQSGWSARAQGMNIPIMVNNFHSFDFPTYRRAANRCYFPFSSPSLICRLLPLSVLHFSCLLSTVALLIRSDASWHHFWHGEFQDRRQEERKREKKNNVTEWKCFPCTMNECVRFSFSIVVGSSCVDSVNEKHPKNVYWKIQFICDKMTIMTDTFILVSEITAYACAVNAVYGAKYAIMPSTQRLQGTHSTSPFSIWCVKYDRE